MDIVLIANEPLNTVLALKIWKRIGLAAKLDDKVICIILLRILLIILLLSVIIFKNVFGAGIMKN